MRFCQHLKIALNATKSKGRASQLFNSHLPDKAGNNFIPLASLALKKQARCVEKIKNIRQAKLYFALSEEKQLFSNSLCLNLAKVCAPCKAKKTRLQARS